MYLGNGTETHCNQQALQRWTEWIKNQFNKTPQELKNTQIDHNDENTWGNLNKTSTTSRT